LDNKIKKPFNDWKTIGIDLDNFLVALTASDYVTNVVLKTTKRNRKTLANPNSAGRRSMNI
jgi:hypothetical protein